MFVAIAIGSLASGWANPPHLRIYGSHHDLQQVAEAVLPSTIGRIWVKVRSSISIQELAEKLAQDENKLAKLNDVDEDHSFGSGDWLVLPSQSLKKAMQIAAIDTSEMRRTPPLPEASEQQETARILFGDSLAKIAARYNLSISELLRLNPGLQAARLVVGTSIRVSQSTPSRSGLSWPEQPEFGNTQSNSGVSSTGLVGPFKRTPEAFARFLNSKPKVWEDPSLRTYFYDLYNCNSFPADSANAMPPSYRCEGGYVSYSDNLGSRKCRLSHVSWTWKEGQSFEASSCR